MDFAFRYSNNYDSTKSMKRIAFPFEPGKIRVCGYSCINEVGVLYNVSGSAVSYLPSSDDPNYGHYSIPPNKKTKFLISSGEAFFTFKTSHGYLLNSKLYVGGGFEIDASKYSFQVPVFFNFRYTPISKRCSPFLSSFLGYTFYTYADEEFLKHPVTGLYTEIQFGARVYISKKVALHISAGYRFQELNRFPYQSPYSTYPYFEYMNVYTIPNYRGYAIKPPTSYVLWHSLTSSIGFTF